MTKQLITFLATAAFAACGSKSPAPAAPAAPAPAEHDDGSGSAVATGPTEPTKPVEPAKPIEPAKPDPEKVKAELMAAETAAYDKAKPVFAKYCASCHTKDGKKAAKKKLDHFTMDTYPLGGHHTASIGNEIRKVLAIDGGKATMPFDKPGSIKGDDLLTIKAWTEAWAASGQAGNHPAESADKD
jgi:mono/diheme cytochrome c family protein